MIKDMKNSVSEWLTLSNIMFVLLFLFSFDRYCLDFVTPETPFMQIAKLPFLRIEFISIIFSIAFLAGVVIALLFKKHSLKLVQISTMFIGLLALIIGIVDVNLFQILFPTMRISHVIMSVSRMTGIILGVSGVFVGISIACLLGQKQLSKGILYGTIIAVAMSVIAISEQWYNIMYILCGSVILLIAIMSQYCKLEKSDISAPKFAIKTNIFPDISTFFGIITFVLMAILGYQYLTISLKTSTTLYVMTLAVAIIGYLICAKLNFLNVSKIILMLVMIIVWAINILLPTAIMTVVAFIVTAVTMGAFADSEKDNSYNNSLTIAIALLISVVVSYILIHYFSEVVKHSNNRVVYYLDAFAMLAPTVSFVLYLISASIPKLTVSKK